MPEETGRIVLGVLYRAYIFMDSRSVPRLENMALKVVKMGT
jgi:hypothetical protein